ncbi:MAG: T9SS type A sorting domain-containing protein [Candidatus Hatepunaea meridiana]|nr:T9SS type A sorting domain-containing protein [Candidatus Hatepunaea meridiana]
MNRKHLNLLLALLMLMIVALPTTAQDREDWIKWTPENGTPIRQGWHTEWFRGGESRDIGQNTGEVVFVWSDTRSTDRGVYLQMVDIEGNLKFDGYGLLVADTDGRQEDPAIWPSPNGDWFIAWEDFDADTLGNIYCTKINSDGEWLWSQNDDKGVPVCTLDNSFQEDIRVVDDTNGGCIIAWKDKRRGDTGDIFAMHINSDGSLDLGNWPRNGRAIVAEAGAQVQITADLDGEGGMIIGWQDGRLDDDYNIWAQRITPSGELLWGEGEGIMICNNNRYQELPKLCPDGDHGAFFCWIDHRNFDQQPLSKDIYVQRVNGAGQLHWGESGTPLGILPEEQVGNRIVVAGNGAAIVMWEDKRDERDTYDIYTMRISGVDRMLKEWDPESGVPVAVTNRNQQQGRLYPDGSGGAFYVWEDERANPYPELDIWAQHIDNEGNPVWQDNGVIVCDAPYLQQAPLVRSATNGRSVYSWEDQRNGSQTIYVQLLNEHGEPEWEEDGIALVDSISGNTSSLKLLSRMNGSFALAWLDGRRGGLGSIPYFQYCRDAGDRVESLMNNDGAPVFSGTRGGSAVPDAVLDNEDGMFVVWQDQRTSNDVYCIYAQRINVEGEEQWGESGLLVSEEDAMYEKAHPHVCNDGDDGIFVAWESRTEDGFVNLFMQHINGDGNLLWEEDITQVTLHEMDELIESFISDGEGGAILLFQGNYPLGGIDQDIWALRINGDGEYIWGDEEEGSIVITDARLKQSDAVIKRHQNGYIVVWVDGQDDDGGQPQLDIFGQFINPDGSFRWRENGVAICGFEYHQASPSIAIDNETHIWVAWVDHRYAGSQRRRDIYIQKFSCRPTDGFQVITLLPEDSGIGVCTANSDQVNPQLVHDGNNGMWVVWEDYRGGVLSDIYATHLNEEATPIRDWGENGRIICDAFHRQETPHAVSLYPYAHTGIVAAWTDMRATGKEELYNIFVQRIDDNIVTAGLPEPTVIPIGFALQQAYPDPFNSMTTIQYTVPVDIQIELNLYDITGRLVKELATKQAVAGTHSVLIDAETLAAGSYIVRLEAEHVKLERKIHLVK